MEQNNYEKSRKSMMAGHSSHWWVMVGVVGFKVKYRYNPTVSIVMLKLNYWWENLYVNESIKKKKEVNEYNNRRN